MGKKRKKKETEIKSSNFPHNGTFLPLNMLMSQSLKRPYLHYRHCTQTLRKKKSEEVKKRLNLLFFIHQRCSGVKTGLPSTAMQDTRYKNAVLQKTSPFHWVSHSHAGCDHAKEDPLRDMFLWCDKRWEQSQLNNHTYSKSPCSGSFVEQCGIPRRPLNLTQTPGVHKTITVLQYV